MTTTHHEALVEATKAAPTITVGGLTLFGVGLSDWVLIATLVYTGLQVYVLVRDKFVRKRNGSERKNAR